MIPGALSVLTLASAFWLALERRPERRRWALCATQMALAALALYLGAAWVAALLIGLGMAFLGLNHSTDNPSSPHSRGWMFFVWLWCGIAALGLAGLLHLGQRLPYVAASLPKTTTSPITEGQALALVAACLALVTLCLGSRGRHP